MYRIDMHSIVYIEADGNYTHTVLLGGQRCTLCINLMQMQQIINEKLKENTAVFARVGKRHIINLHYVYYINSAKQQLVLSDGMSFSHEICLSKEALRSLKELFMRSKTTDKS